MRITMKDESRINIIESVKGGEITLIEGSRLLGVSVRQVNRLLIEFKDKGIRGLIHGNRGRSRKKNRVWCDFSLSQSLHG